MVEVVHEKCTHLDSCPSFLMRHMKVGNNDEAMNNLEIRCAENADGKFNCDFGPIFLTTVTICWRIARVRVKEH